MLLIMTWRKRQHHQYTTYMTSLAYVTYAISWLGAQGPHTGAALHENNEATAKSTSQDGGMAVNFG